MPKGDPFKDQLKKLQAELAKQQKDLEGLQEQHRKKPDPALQKRIHEAKLRFGARKDEEAEILRSISRAAGGRQLGVDA